MVAPASSRRWSITNGQGNNRFLGSGRPLLLTPIIQRLDSHEPRRVSQALFDAQQLVVLGGAVGARGRAGLDLSRARADGEVGDERVFRFARAMRDHAGVLVPPRQLD